MKNELEVGGTSYMDSIEGNSWNELTGGEIFSIKWSQSNKKSLHIVLPVSDEEFYFVELGEDTYWTKYETLIEEIQPLEDIVDYLEYLVNSQDATVEFMGKLNKEETYLKIYQEVSKDPIMDWRKSKTITFSKTINDFISTVRKMYTLMQEIHELPIRSGDVMSTFNVKGQPVVKERLTQVSENGYVILPIKRVVETSQEDEEMPKEELYEYIYSLATEEKRSIVWQSTFCPQKARSIISLSDKDKIGELLS